MPKQNLSVQVHPSNEYALKKEHQYGKTEMWYVLDCLPGAYLYYGFDHEISKEEFAERIKNNTLTEVLNAVPVHKGDCFYPVRHAARHLPRHRHCRGAAKLQRDLPCVRLWARECRRQAPRAAH